MGLLIAVGQCMSKKEETRRRKSLPKTPSIIFDFGFDEVVLIRELGPGFIR